MLNLRQLRRAKGKTIPEAAKYFDVHDETIRRWERRTSAPRDSQITDAVKFYGVSLEQMAAHIEEVSEARKEKSALASK